MPNGFFGPNPLNMSQLGIRPGPPGVLPPNALPASIGQAAANANPQQQGGGFKSTLMELLPLILAGAGGALAGGSEGFGSALSTFGQFKEKDLQREHESAEREEDRQLRKSESERDRLLHKALIGLRGKEDRATQKTGAELTQTRDILLGNLQDERARLLAELESTENVNERQFILKRDSRLGEIEKELQELRGGQALEQIGATGEQDRLTQKERLVSSERMAELELAFRDKELAARVKMSDDDRAALIEDRREKLRAAKVEGNAERAQEYALEVMGLEAGMEIEKIRQASRVEFRTDPQFGEVAVFLGKDGKSVETAPIGLTGSESDDQLIEYIKAKERSTDDSFAFLTTEQQDAFARNALPSMRLRLQSMTGKTGGTEDHSFFGGGGLGLGRSFNLDPDSRRVLPGTPDFIRRVDQAVAEKGIKTLRDIPFLRFLYNPPPER